MTSVPDSHGFSQLKYLLLGTVLASSMAAQSPGIDVEGMNPAIAPGDDFYAYASGKWMERTEIPADRVRVW